MKLLFDQNLSVKLAVRLADLFPGSSHVQSIGLDCATDEQIWEHAKLNGFAVVSKDEDFNHLSVVRGIPPKIIWLQLGNCTTAHKPPKPDVLPTGKREKTAGIAARLPHQN